MHRWNLILCVFNELIYWGLQKQRMFAFGTVRRLCICFFFSNSFLADLWHHLDSYGCLYAFARYAWKILSRLIVCLLFISPIKLLTKLFSKIKKERKEIGTISTKQRYKRLFCFELINSRCISYHEGYSKIVNKGWNILRGWSYLKIKNCLKISLPKAGCYVSLTV